MTETSMTVTHETMNDGALIRVVRTAFGIRQRDLARSVDITQQALSQIELGLTRNSPYVPLLKIKLGIPVDARLEHWLAVAQQVMASRALAVTDSQGANVALAAPETILLAQLGTPIAPVDPALLDQAPATACEAPHSAAQAEREAQQRARQARLDADYELFAAEQLRIRSKRGTIEPLVFNRIQRHIHAALEAQKAKTGKVRALILKGRLQGCSTYVGGRYYHRASRTAGQRVFILTHAEQATRNLFEMVERFQTHCADAPTTSVSNAHELRFDALDSGYTVGTAGTRGVGRSATLQMLHGSEVAYWPHAETHAAGVLQAVADEPGTEVILEFDRPRRRQFLSPDVARR